MKIRTVIVEDEPLARQHLRDLLAPSVDFEIVGESADGKSALATIEACRPDLVFLDVQMPELDGFSLLRRLQHRPAVIFTTAYDRYAVAAFELAALDYLLKPFGRERFYSALARARERLGETAGAELDAARQALAPSAQLDRLFVRHAGKIIPLAPAEIDRLEADGDYVAVFARGRRYLVHLSLAEFEARLDPAHFARVHRSHIVNLSCVESFQPEGNAQLRLRLRDGTTLIASRNASKALRNLAV